MRKMKSKFRLLIRSRKNCQIFINYRVAIVSIERSIFINRLYFTGGNNRTRRRWCSSCFVIVLRSWLHQPIFPQKNCFFFVFGWFFPSIFHSKNFWIRYSFFVHGDLALTIHGYSLQPAYNFTIFKKVIDWLVAFLVCFPVLL